MNINELADNNTNPTKENQKEVIENLDNTALKIKAENKLEELDKKSKELIEILEKFSKKVPPMINRLDTINEGLKLEPMKKTLASIKTNSEIAGIHNILIGQKRYWLNEDNHKIYIKQAEIKK